MTSTKIKHSSVLNRNNIIVSYWVVFNNEAAGRVFLTGCGGGGILIPPFLGLLFFFSKTVGMPTILDIATKLVLPKNLPFTQCLLVPHFYSFYQLYGHILIPTSIPSIVVSQAPYQVFDLSLMVAVSFLKGGSTFPHILPPTLLTGCKVNEKRGITNHFLSDGVRFPCVCALECPPLPQNWA